MTAGESSTETKYLPFLGGSIFDADSGSIFDAYLHNILETAYNYRFNGTDDGPSLVLGARLMDIAIRMSPGDLPTLAAGPNWWDYFVGVKTHNTISPKWDFDFYGTIGTGGSDLPWTVQAMFGRKFSNGNRLGLGARVWGIDYSENKGLQGQFSALDLTFYGLMLGYEFN